MADYLNLFLDKRLTPTEPHHLEYIKGRLAALKVEDPKAYAEYSAHYGVGMDVTVTKEPASLQKEVAKSIKPKKVK